MKKSEVYTRTAMRLSSADLAARVRDNATSLRDARQRHSHAARKMLQGMIDACLYEAARRRLNGDEDSELFEPPLVDVAIKARDYND